MYSRISSLSSMMSNSSFSVVLAMLSGSISFVNRGISSISSISSTILRGGTMISAVSAAGAFAKMSVPESKILRGPVSDKGKTGRYISKAVPLFTSLVTAILPPCKATNSLTKAKPIPVPLGE